MIIEILLEQILSTIISSKYITIKTAEDTYCIPLVAGQTITLIHSAGANGESQLIMGCTGLLMYIESMNMTDLVNYMNMIMAEIPDYPSVSGYDSVPITEGIVNVTNASGGTVVLAENFDRKFLAIQNTQSGNLYFSVTTGVNATTNSFILTGAQSMIVYDTVVPTGDVKFYVASGSRVVKYQVG